MKILIAHNYYQLKGGEDSVVANEIDLLRANGHTVITYFRHNDEIKEQSSINKAKLLLNTTYSKEAYFQICKVIEKEQPDICHVHNFFPLITPAIYDACKDNNIPVVQTLHNFRLICTNGLFLRDGKICEDCLGKSAYGAVSKKCYRNSSIQTFAVARMIESHKQKKTWKEKVDRYLCLSEFSRAKFVKANFPEEKLQVKPNFVETTDKTKDSHLSPYFIFVGRIDSTKGIELLIEIAKTSPLPIKLIGEGDLSSLVINKRNIEYLGKRPNVETQEYIRNATALLFPSILYEGMPMTILEAFANKTPVIASNLGAMQAMITHKKNGLLFEPNNKKELTDLINFVVNKKVETNTIIDNAYTDFLNKYSKESNYKQLISIYKELIEQKDK